jgi:outer membrane immunogenic protein
MKFAHLLMAGAALAVSMASAASAADLLKPADPVYSSPLFNFEGFYVGGTAGGALSSGVGYGTLGVVVGANFAISDGIMAGVEFQGDAYYNGGFTAYDALALGRVGGFVADNTMLYGDIGAGFKGGVASYAFGGGAEMALTDQLGLRGDLQIIGGFGAWPSTGKATVGLMWHLN